MLRTWVRWLPYAIVSWYARRYGERFDYPAGMETFATFPGEFICVKRPASNGQPS